eukprot:398674-Amphidinium_carterae.2
MPGPWLCPRLDPDYLPFWSIHPGETVEIQAYDDGGYEQGCVLLKVVDVAPSSKAGCEVAAQYVASSDSYYRHWMAEGGHQDSRGWMIPRVPWPGWQLQVEGWEKTDGPH